MAEKQDKTTVGARKSLWFSASQIDLLEELKVLTGDSGSNIVRESLSVYRDLLIKQASK